ncbi:MAG: RDD family protein [Gordonia sp. (in: high G+C Gram-positive bacteria)]
MSTRPVERNAGIVSRMMAAGVDVAAVTALLAGVYLGVAFVIFLLTVHDFQFPVLNWVFTTSGFLVAAVVYQTACWTMSGRTVGQLLMGLRVERQSGRRLRAVQSFLRAGFCTVFPLGLFWVVLSPSRLSLQDIVLRTRVVYADEHHSPVVHG